MTVKELKDILEKYSDDTEVKVFNEISEKWENANDYDLKFYAPPKFNVQREVSATLRGKFFDQLLDMVNSHPEKREEIFEEYIYETGRIIDNLRNELEEADAEEKK